MKYLFFLILFWIPLKGLSISDSTVNQFFQKSKFYSSIQYNIEYKIKYFDEDTILGLVGSCRLYRKQEDTLFQGTFIYKNLQDNKEKIYDGNHIYIFQPNKLTLYGLTKKEIKVITSNADVAFIKSYFLDISNLEKTLNDSANKIKYLDTLLNESKYKVIIIDYPDEGEYKKGTRKIYLNSTSLTIERIEFQIQYKDQIQNNKWVFSNVKLGNNADSSIHNRINLLKKSHKIVIDSNEKLKNVKTSIPSEKFPLVRGIFLEPEKKIPLNKYDKVTIYDFWFNSCSSCIHSVPFLNNIYQKYKNEIEVIGLNDIDTSIISIHRSQLFINRENVKYPMLTVSRKSFSKLKVLVYPTLFIVDKNGKIRYRKEGYSKDDNSEIETIILGLLNKKSNYK